MSWVIGCPSCGGTLLVSPGTQSKTCPCGYEDISVAEQIPAESCQDTDTDALEPRAGLVGERQGLRQAFGIKTLMRCTPINQARPSHPAHPSSRYLLPPRMPKRLLDWPHTDPVPLNNRGEPCKLCVKWKRVCDVHDPTKDFPPKDVQGKGKAPKHLPEEYHGVLETEAENVW